MKYSNEVYIGALQALAALRSKVSDKEKATIDFVAEAIAEKGDRDMGERPEPNEALTLDELRKMDGEPVWIVEYPNRGHWELSECAGDYLLDRDPDFYGMKHNDPNGRYGLHELGWIAYRRKPEEEPHE